MKLKNQLLLFSISLLSLSTLVQANDGVFAGKGSAVFPIKETKIQMLSEDILFEQDENLGWKITAKYQFRNPTNETISLQMGFPEFRCSGDCGSDGEGSWTIRDFKTYIRQKLVSHRIGKIKPNDLYQKGERVFLFDITFKPKETVSVDHTYHHQASGSVEGDELAYITETGKLWNGPIQSARFAILMLKRPHHLGFHPSYQLREFSEYINQKTKKPQTKIVFEMKNWTPQVDFELGYNGYSFLPEKKFNCPILENFMEYNRKVKKNQLTNKKKFEKGIKSFSDLDLCRNLIYAKHGYPFKNKDLTQKFYEKPKRIHSISPNFILQDESLRPSSEYIIILLRKNRKYSDDLITSEEKKYIGWLQSEKKQRQN